MVLEKALTRATAQDGTISYAKLNSELIKAGSSAAKLTDSLAKGGTMFLGSLNAANSALALSNRSAITLGKQMKEIWRVTTQSFKFTAAQTFLRAISKEAQAAKGWVVDLNDAVNRIATVTGKTGDEITRLTEQAVKGSQQLKVAAKDYAEGALIFYQQGLNDEEVTRRNEITIKASLAANQSIETMSQQLTAIWNTYGMVGEEQQRAASVGAALAAQTAVDFADIAQAMQSAAAPAAQMGVEYNQLAAIIATVGDVTQQSASTIGNAYKTIFSRFQQLKAEGTDGEVTLSSISSQLESMGIHVLDSAGNLRELGTVINEVGQNWDNWTQTQQTAIAQIVGGTRQYGQFLALMQNFDKYEKNLGVANGETGSTLESQYTQALDSIDHKMEVSAEAWKRAFAELIPEDALKTFYDTWASIADVVGTILKGAGGLPGILATVGVALSSKIVPTLVRAKQEAASFMQNLTPQGRINGIQKDYSNQRNQLDKSIASAGQKGNTDEVRSLEIQKEKLKVNEQIAIMNEKINTTMKIANAEDKVGLEQNKGRLTSMIDINQSAIDQAANLERQYSLLTQITSETEKQAILEREAAQRAVAASEAKAQSLLQQIGVQEANANNKNLSQADQDTALQTAIGLRVKYGEVIAELTAQYEALSIAEENEKRSRDITTMVSDLNNLNKALSTLNSGGTTGMSNIKMGQQMEELRKRIMDVVGSVDKLTPELREALTVFNDIESKTDLDTQSLNKMSEALNTLAQQAGILTGKSEALSSEMITSAGDFQRVGQAVKEVEKNIDDYQAKVKGIGQPIGVYATANAFVQLGFGIGQCITAMKNLYSIWKDPDTSFLDKLIATFSQLSTMMFTFKMMSTQGETALRSLGQLGTNIAKSLGIELAATGASASAAGAGLTAAGAGGTAAGAGLTATAEGAEAATVSLSTLIVPIGIALAAILAVAAAIGGITLAYKEWEKSSPEEQAKRAAKATEELKTEAEEAKSAADGLRTSFDKYESAQEALSKCTKGTDEFKSALSAANGAALELLDAVSGLSSEDLEGLYSRDKDGNTVLNEDKVKALQDKLDKQATTSDYIAKSSEAQSELAASKNKAYQSVKSSGVNNDTGGIVGGGLGLAATATGFMLGGPAGIVAGYGAYKAGQYAKDVDDRKDTDKIMDNIEGLMDALSKGDEAFIEELNSLGIYVKQGSDAFEQLKSDISSFGAEALAAKQKMELLADLTIDEVLGDNYDGATKNVSADKLLEAQDSIYESAMKDMKKKFNKGDWLNNSEDEADLVARYNKASGKNLTADKNFARGTDNNREFAFRDENNELVVLEAEQIAQTIAASEALAEITTNAEGLSQKLNELSQTTEGSQLKSVLANDDFNASMTEEQAKGMMTKDGEVSAASVDLFLMQALGVDKVGDIEQAAEEMGLSIDYLREKVTNGVQRTVQGFENVGNQLSRTAEKVYNEMDLSKLTVNERQAVGNTIQRAADVGGEENAENVAKFLRENFGKKMGEAAEVLEDINWDDITPEILAKRLEEAGVSIGGVNKRLPELIKRMKEIANLSLDEGMSKYNDYREIANKITDDTSVLSDEDIGKLEEAGINVEKFFTKLADGSYALDEDADKIRNIINDLGKEAFKEGYDNTVEQRDLIAGAQKGAVGQDGDYLGKLDILEVMGGITEEYANSLRNLFDSQSENDQQSAVNQINQAFEEAGYSVQDFQQKIDELDIDLAEAQAGMKETEFRDTVDREGLDLEKTQKYAKDLQEETVTVKDKDGNSIETKRSEEAARKLAIANQKVDRGLESLNDNLKDYKKKLKDANKGSAEWSDAMSSLKKDLKDITGFTDEDLITDEFAQAALASGDLEKAINGDQEALQRLRTDAYTTLGDDIVGGFTAKIEEEMAASPDDNSAYLQQLQDRKNAVSSAWSEIQEIMGRSLPMGMIDASDVAAFESDMNTLISEADMSREEISSMLGSMGVDAEIIEGEPKEITTFVPRTTTSNDVKVDGSSVIEKNTIGGVDEEHVKYSYTDTGTVKTDYVPEKTQVPSYAIKMNTDEASSGGSIINKGGGGGGGKKPSGGGGSKSAAKHTAKTAVKQQVRYTDRKNAIEDITNATNKLSTANDHAWGPQRIRNLEIINKKLRQQAKEYQLLRKEAERYIASDSEELQKGIAFFNAKWGTDLTARFDPDGLLDNEEEIENKIIAEQNKIIQQIRIFEDLINAEIKATGSEEGANIEDWKAEVEALKDKLSELEEDAEQEVLTRKDNLQDAWRELEAAMEREIELVYEHLQNLIEKYSLKMELHLEISDLDYQLHEALIDNMGEIGKLSHEVTELISKDLTRLGTDAESVLENYDKMMGLAERWKNGDESLKDEFGIDDEVWAKARESGQMPDVIKDALRGDIDSLIDIRDQIWNKLDQKWQNYIDVVQYYIDEYDRITDRLDKQVSISDNLLSIIETTGLNYKWGANESAAQYKNMSTQMEILTTKAKNLNGELAIATSRRKEAEEELNKLLAGRNAYEFSQTSNEAEKFEYNRIKEHYDEMADLEADLNEQRIGLMAEAYEKAAEYAEQWGEVIRHEFDESLNALFDSMDEAMDVYNQKRDIDTFFMDDVDRVFELNKLQREINDVIDDISNPEQLARYNALLGEIEAKKADGVKMTEKDLEILQAQFNLEQARDAYEDARNAKNSMRLMRDASGNYSYVYSADQDNIDDAEAKVEEAMHNIYKLHREAADEYAETWLQLQVDWESYIAEIDQARYAQDVEYREMVDQRMQWYSQQSDMLSQEIIKHNDAIDRSFTDMTLSVITNTEDMALTNDMYKQHHTELKDKLIENYQLWIEKADETMEEVGGSMSDLEDVVDDQTEQMMTEVSNLKEKINEMNTESQMALSEFAGFIGSWVTEVNNQFDLVIAKIDAVIKKYRDLLQAQKDQMDEEDEMSQYQYDAERNYSASIMNRAAYLKGLNYSEEEIMEDYYIKRWTGERWNKKRDSDMQGHKEYSGGISYSAVENETRELIAAIDKNTAAINESDASNRSKEVGNKNSEFEHGKDYSKADYVKYSDVVGHATGGIVKTPQVIGVAEEGPELVLNNEDTNKILEAVRLVRAQTQQALASRTIETALRTLQQEALLSDYQRSYAAGQQGALEQNVHIEASFPNINTAAEVEAALNSLIVQAAHYSVVNK